MNTPLKNLLFPSLLLLGIAASDTLATADFNTNADTTQYYIEESANSVYTIPTAGDLLYNVTPTSTNYNSIDGTSISILTDGLDTARALDLDGFTAYYSLGNNPNGYTINEIDTYSAAGDYRAGQEFQIWYSLASDPTNFIQLISPYTTSDRLAGTFQTIADGTVQPGQVEGAYNDQGGNFHMTITPDQVSGGTSFLTGVADIEFISTIPSGNSATENTSYQELAVYGTPDVPEPSSYALLGAGLLALTLTLRRRLS